MVTLSRNFVEKLAGLKDSSKFENLFLLLCNVRISTADFKILQKSSILTPLLIRLSGVYQEQINLEMISKYLYCDDLDFKFAVLEALSHIKDLDWILSLDIYSLIESAANCNHWFILISCANLISKLHSALKPRFIGDLLLGMLHKPDLVLNALEIMIRILGAREKSTFVDHQVCLAVLDIIISGNDRIASEKSFEIVAVIMERGSRLDVGILESAMASATSTKLEIFKLICHDLDLSGDINNINGACSVIQMIFQKFEPPRHFAKFKDLMDFLGPVLNSPCITRPELLKRNAAVDDTLELIKFCTSRLKNIAWQQNLAPICIGYLKPSENLSKHQISILLDALKFCDFGGGLDFLISILKTSNMTIKSRRAALEIILAKSKTILERESIVQVLEEGLTNEDWAIRDLSIDLTSKLFSLSPELFWNSKLPKLVIGLLQDKEVYIRKVGLGMLLRLLKTKKLPPLFVSELEKQAMDCISHADSLILADFIKVFNTGAMRHLITIAMFKSWLEHEQYDIRVEAIKVCISDLSEPYNSKLSKMLHLVKPLKTDLSRVVKLEFIELVELGLNQHTFKEFQNYCSTVDLEKLKLMTDLNELYNEEWYLNESVLDDSRGDDPLNCYDCYDC